MNILDKIVYRFFNGYKPKNKKIEVDEYDNYFMLIIPKQNG